MPIYDQSFRRYEGPRSTRALWWVVARNTIRPFLKAKLIARLLSGAGILGPVILASIALFMAAKFQEIVAEGKGNIEQFARGGDFPVFGYNMNIQSMLFLFIDATTNVFWLLIAVYGAGCISQDRKYFALPLYFSRPLTMFDYMVGKIGGLSVYPIGILTICITVIFLQAWAYFYSPSEALGHLPTLLGAFAWIIANGLMMALSMAAFSSVTKSAAAATVMYVGFWFVSMPLSHIISEFAKRPEFGAISLGHSLNVLGLYLLHPEVKWTRDNPNNIDFGLIPALGSIALFSWVFLWLIRRNLRVVEVVK